MLLNTISGPRAARLELAPCGNFQRVHHPATLCALAINALAIFVAEIGNVAWIQDLFTVMKKG